MHLGSSSNQIVIYQPQIFSAIESSQQKFSAARISKRINRQHLIFFIVQVEEMDVNLLVGEKAKLKAAEICSQPLPQWFFQERDQFRIDQLKYQLLDALIDIDQTKTNTKKDLISLITKNYYQFLTSVITFTSPILELTQNFNTLFFSHKHHTSQSILLSLILRRKTGNKVVLMVNQHKLKRMCQMFQNQEEVDTVFFVSRCLEQEKIQIINLNEKGIKELQTSLSKDHILIMDVFGLEPPNYYLEIERHMSTLRQGQKVFFYHSSAQDQQINYLFDIIEKRSFPLESIKIELDPPHPVQHFYYEQEDQLFSNVTKFVDQIAPYAQKQDILIFYPLDEPFHQYFRRIKESTVKLGIKDHLNFITSNNQKIYKQKINVFLVHSNKQLIQWSYNYQKIFMVLDYGFQERFIYDYQLGCFVEIVTKESQMEKEKRMRWIGSDRAGKYHCLETEINYFHSFYDYYSDISAYLVSAIAYKQDFLIDFHHPRVKKCLQFLVNTHICYQKGEKTYQLKDQRFITYIDQGMLPIEIKMILSVVDDSHLIDKNKQKYLNLMSMTISILRHGGNLRRVKRQIEGSHIKPYAVWRKSGYLQSCLEIITKCQLIEHRKQPQNSKSQDFRRKTSKVIEGHELYSKNALKRKKRFEQMQIPDLISEYSVNEQLLIQIRDYIDDLRFIFEFQMIPILIDRQSILKMMTYLSQSGPQTSLSLYTGSKTTQYFNTKGNLHLNDSCLFSILNQRPQILKIMRIRQQQGQKKILMANTVSKETYLQLFGKLPTFQRPVVPRNESHEVEVEKIAPTVTEQFCFENIPSAVFEELAKNNGQTIQSFEYQNNCHLYLFVEIGKIKISCFKDEIQNKHYVWQNLNQILSKLTQICEHYTKKLHYMGIVNFILTEGGKVLEMIDSDQISRCLVSRLPNQIAKQYVEVVMEGYPFKNIQIIEPDEMNPLPSAIIEFYSKRGYQEFADYYNANLRNENFFEMKPLSDSQFRKMKQSDEDGGGFGHMSTTLLFRWYVWKSHGQAQVKFKNPDTVQKTIKAFQVNPYLDSIAVKIESDPKDPCVININNLKPHTDEIYISEALKEYGPIQSVQILKTPLKETLGDAEHIGHLLKKGANSQEIVKHKVLSIEKKECGLRVAKVAVVQQYRINRICERLNKSIKLFGQGRLYVEPIYQKQVLIPDGCLQIYTQLFQELMESLQKNQPNVRTQIREDSENQNIYLMVISSIEETLHFVMNRFKQKLSGIKIDFPFQARNIILNEIGVANFLDMQQKYNCKFIVSSYTNKIKVLCRQEALKMIVQETERRLEYHFFYKVNLTSKVYKHFQEHPQLLEELQKQYELSLSQLEEDEWAILLQGNVKKIQQAVIWLHQKIKIKSDKVELAKNNNLCGICGSELDDSYRLFCTHRFCKECIVDYLRYSLSDMSQFPFRCPELQCRKYINCMDLEHLLEFGDWLKIRTFSANQFLKNNDYFDYCITAGCQQINRVQKKTIGGVSAEFTRCDICKNSYCLECGGAYHPARTCAESKMSQDVLMKNFISEQGVRKCAGKKCRALVYRYTGCFKVQCIRCGTCMCFKCPANKMQAFPDSTSCYNHLNNEHGGYF